MKADLIKFNDLKEAILKLNEGLKERKSELERDGVLQRFEFTFELAWKVVQEYAKYQGVEVASPREAIRVGAELSIIEDPDKWFVDLQNRNLTTHIYDARNGGKNFPRSKRFCTKSEPDGRRNRKI